MRRQGSRKGGGSPGQRNSRRKREPLRLRKLKLHQKKQRKLPQNLKLYRKMWRKPSQNLKLHQKKQRKLPRNLKLYRRKWQKPSWNLKLYQNRKTHRGRLKCLPLKRSPSCRNPIAGSRPYHPLRQRRRLIRGTKMRQRKNLPQRGKTPVKRTQRKKKTRRNPGKSRKGCPPQRYPRR